MKSVDKNMSLEHGLFAAFVDKEWKLTDLAIRKNGYTESIFIFYDLKRKPFMKSDRNI